MLKKVYFIISTIFVLAALAATICPPRRAAAASANSHSPLINQNEQVLFSFKVEKSEKIATIAIDPGDSEYIDYIVYRFGTKDKIELEFPADKENSWEKFTFSHFTRPSQADTYGLDSNYFTFTNGDYTYTIYEEHYLGNETTDETYKVGIKIKNNLNNKEFDIKGDPHSIVGSLMDLRDDGRIKIE